MLPGDGRRERSVLALLATGGALAFLPAPVVAQPVDPGVVTEAPGFVRAVGAFVAVCLVGAGILWRHGGVVDRAVDDTMARPAAAAVYGVVAYVLVLFPGFYVNTVLAQAGLARTPVVVLVGVVFVGGLALVGSLGLVVVGTLLTDLSGVRRPWQGLALGAALGAVGWVVLPPTGAVAVWVFLTAVGVGGRTRTWVHSERTVPPRSDG